jgi:non-lysosomal glucosylceramidase
MYSSWDSDIAEWQDSILADTELPDYYKSLLFNELYFITDGGTVWTDSVEGEPRPRARGKEERKDGGVEESHQFQQLVTVDADRQLMVIDANAASEFNHVAQNCEGDQAIIGQFLYLEGHEYLMYNTYDVHFYASFALLQLWPVLELSIQRDFARAVAVEDMDLRTMLGDGHVRPRKLAGSIAHDLGSPCEHPWKKPNIYNFQDVSQWKDLGPKFILQVYRDHMFVIKNTSKSSNPSKFLAALYDTCKRVMESCRRFDRDHDGMIENDGVPDQTYDIWSVTGVSAYCGGLWCAACSAMAAMAYCMDDAEAAALYDDLAAKARAVYDEQLWNGRYFNYDNNGGYSHDSIMADQLAGQWYCRVCDLPPVTEPAKAFSSYRTIFEHNVERFGNGRLLGAVNGMRPNGEVDSSALQAREVWTGTTYAVAAAMLLEAKALTTADAVPALADDDQLALVRMAFTTAQGIYEAGWKEFGYWFATPEGWERSGNYRSLGYMRPLAVWAIHFAWEKCYRSSSTANRGVVL